jgi:predicted DsbA family dithiol-disulfide isomerase
MIETREGTITVFADPTCPWAHAAIYQLHAARERHGLRDGLSFDIRAFPLELHNSRPTPKMTIDPEMVVIGGRVPQAGWSQWHAALFTYPVTALPALEAVYAAKTQGLDISDRLDRALRVAFFRDSRCISIHSVILEVAAEVEALDVAALARSLRAGDHRREVFDDFELSRSDTVQGSPHVFLPDGSDHPNPGVDMSWEDHRNGFPVIHGYDPSVYDELVRTAVRTV